MKQLRITVNGKSYDVSVEELGSSAAPVATPAAAPVAAPAPAAAPAAAPAHAAAPAVSGEGDPVNSPMPGTILDIKVSAGQSVSKGDVLVILEAMKMENEICADKDGVVGAVLVNKGESVESGKALLTINQEDYHAKENWNYRNSIA